MSKLYQVFIIGGLIRSLLPTLVPSITAILSSSVEITTPITSFKALKEAFYFFNNNIDLYDGGVNHNPPLLVMLLSFINSLPFADVWFHVLFALVDVVIAWHLVRINRWYKMYTSKRTGKTVASYNDDLIASFYLFNPLVLLSNLSHSTIAFVWLFLVVAVYQVAVKRQASIAIISLAISTYLSFNSLYLLPSILGLIHATSTSRNVGQIYILNIAVFFTTLAILASLSFAFTSSWQFLDNCYLSVILFEKITPNVGLWWYIFTEMFEFFTPFYIGMFNIYSFIFIIPLTLKLFEFKKVPKQGDSLLAIVLTLLWISFTKSYPTIGDLGFVLSLIPIFRGTVLPYCKVILITGMTLMVSLLLSPIFYYCWIVLGNGNSNFFYSINLIWGGVHILAIMDLLWAKLISDYSVENSINEEDIRKLNLAQL
ncbi:hypothetical protein KGF56_003900 [Candida oxycetoniae]|uniref:GPI transamidase component GAB1 n=1 Tax=Candida oxycetoniae TaxID=497107 RepID=A0AAI9SUU0_9ASCO|nr:uncharacterized protein KGF56_003900 [Candida oxycetoniae]KAI3403312.2 hypothetical protein KGF56_003900 [Candida oxycetoniae]